MKTYVYEDIVDDPAKAQTMQIEVTPDGDIVNRTTTGRLKGRTVPVGKFAEPSEDPQVVLIKKALEDPTANGAALETELNAAREKLKMPKIRWLKDATPAPYEAPAAKTST